MLTEQIIAAAIAVRDGLGPGPLETAYQSCLEYELSERGVHFDRQVSVPVVYRGVRINCGYRVDLLVEGSVVGRSKQSRPSTPS